MKKVSLLWYTMVLLFCVNLSFAQENSWDNDRPDAHAPIRIMGDHYHHKGQLMFSYRYMPMLMKANISSSRKISNQEIYKKYMAAPRKMQMDMHMLGVMYAPLNRLTLMLMANYIRNKMESVNKKGRHFTTRASGFGDISLSGLVKIINKNRQSVHANIGFSIPTGNITKRDDNPMMKNALLGYPMQLGSGTWDPFVGMTYRGQTDLLSWGAQSIYKMRIGNNVENYRLGNRFDALAWFSIKTSDYFSFSTDVSFFNIAKTSGFNSRFNPKMAPVFDKDNSGKNQLDVGFGSNFYIPKGKFKDLRFAVEFKLPLMQSVTGIQMKSLPGATFGVQYTLQ